MCAGNDTEPVVVPGQGDLLDVIDEDSEHEIEDGCHE